MGKRQHQKDKMYLTCTEWSTIYGGKKILPPGEGSEFRRLPFDHCSLSLQPFEHPLCTMEGHIFDLMNIVPFLKKFGTNPITGKKLDAKSLVKLNFHKNAEGKYHCPVLYKVFNKNSHIVAIKGTGNVFCNEAVEQLNLKSKNLKDLLTDETFDRKDIITLQDPSNLDKFNLANFYHIKESLKVEDEDEVKARKDPMFRLKSVSAETKDILDELKREYKPQEPVVEEVVAADKFNAAHYSTGDVAASFTSTAMQPTTKHEAAIIDETVVRYSRVKKKGYVRIVTNLGPLNVELHCDMVPKTCENFIKLCQRGYYNNVIFHRSIKNFMIQGGDPTGTGKGGESFWGKPFEDEFKTKLTHTGRGILSMANNGPDCNKSQFFITYRSCKHLDGKHSVFGRVVGGLETLTLMERVQCDKKDTPKETIKIEKTVVFVDPFEDVDAELVKLREEEKVKKGIEDAKKLALRSGSITSKEPRVFKQGVGKYINPGPSTSKSIEPSTDAPERKKKKTVASEFKDFSSW